MSRGSKYKDEDLVSKSEGVKIEHKGANCYIYTRVSTMKQVEEGGSLEAQRDRVLEYVKYDNMSVVGEYTDEGISGKSAEQRPGFQQMIEDIQNKKDDIQFVLVYKLSRFGRNASDILYYLQIMQDNGVNLICVEDHIDSSVNGKYFSINFGNYFSIITGILFSIFLFSHGLLRGIVAY